ncbi:MAG: cytochrome c biogenesis protein CcsA [Pirellulales bacterium]
MLAGISLTCFTASYAVALLLEITRMWFRSGLRGVIMLGFAAAGVFAHTIYLGKRATESIGTPLSSEFDWYLIAAWALAAVYLGWSARQQLVANERRTAVGIFILPLVLGLVAVGYYFGGRQPLAREVASNFWVRTHLTCLALGFVSVLVGFVIGVMDLVQASRLKRKIPPQQGLKLPSLEWLERSGVRSVYASFVLLALGLLTGVILNMVNGQFEWSDPTVLRFAVVVFWQTAATTFLSLYRPARQGRKTAYITIATAVIVLLSLGLGHFLPSRHGAPRKEQGTASLEQGAKKCSAFAGSPLLAAVSNLRPPIGGRA